MPINNREYLEKVVNFLLTNNLSFNILSLNSFNKLTQYLNK